MMNCNAPGNQTTRRTVPIACAAALAMACTASLPQPAHAYQLNPPRVPSNIQGPTANKAFLKGHAVGTLSMAQAHGGVKTKAHGMDLGEWMNLYWTWALGGDQDDHEKRFAFLPLPAGTDDDGDGVFVGEIDVKLHKEKKFVLPIFVQVGETYEGGVPPDDDPSALPPEIFTGVDLLITLDGNPIIDSNHDDITKFFFAAEYFDEPIMYDEPGPFGAVGAIFTQGLGFLHSTLKQGHHTLHLHVFSPDFGIGFENTWNITVASN